MTSGIALSILTHHKCASNWMRRICREMERADLISYEIARMERRGSNHVPASAAPRVILDVNTEFVCGPEDHISAPRLIHFVRDPRDALVSTYWSWLKSHSNNTDEILSFRARAADMSVEDGLLALIPAFPMGNQLQTWPADMFDRVRRIRYEDLLTAFEDTLVAMFAHGDIHVPPDAAARIRRRTSFEKITGRKRGDERVDEHYRKGVAGDWRTYFTPPVSDAFHARHGWLGERLGYW